MMKTLRVIAALALLAACSPARAGFTIPVGIMGKVPPPTVEIDFTNGFPSGAIAARTGDPVFVQTSAVAVVSRAAGAGGVYEPFSDGGEGGGCWMFPAFTNDVPNPNDHSVGAGWTPNLGTANEVYTGPNVIVAPDGTTTADTIEDASATGYCLRYYNAGTPANRTMSVWVKDHAGNAPTAPGMLVHDTSLLTGATYGNNLAWHRVSDDDAAQYTLSGISPAGVQPGATITNSAVGAVDVWGSQDVVSYSDLPLANSATGASTIQIASGNLANLLHNGDFDAKGRVLVYSDGNDIPITDGYLFSAATPDGLLAVRFENPNWILTVRGVDVLTVANAPAGFQRGAEIEWRAWFKPGTGHAGMRIRSNGAQALYDTTGSATGSPLATPTAAWFGSNLGVSGFFTGKQTYFKTSANDSNAPIEPEFVVLGDSISGPFYRFATTAGGIYTDFEARSHAGIESLAVAGEQIADQKARWDASQYVGDADVKAVLILVGLNDIITGNSSSTVLSRLQGLVDDIHGTNPTTKILVGTLTPCASYLGPTMYAVWLAVNAGIPSLTSVDAVFSGQTAALNDGSGNLIQRCNSGDGIHPWNPCRMTIASFERAALVGLGLL